MDRTDRVRSFASDSPEYHRAFRTFLAHTDQKANALGWLRGEVDALAARSVLIDAGAGNGALTARLAPRFDRVVAIEPNPSLEAELRAACPAAVVLPTTIAAAAPPDRAEFVISAHTFYYIPRAEWEANFRRLLGWLAPGGVLAIALQNPGSDGMRMVHHFLGARFDLGDLRRSAAGFEVRLETIPALVRAPDLETACAIAEFMLNVLPMHDPPSRADLERYVADQFRQADGGYRFSCHQDFLRAARPA